jgi:hypothetical protein
MGIGWSFYLTYPVRLSSVERSQCVPPYFEMTVHRTATHEVLRTWSLRDIVQCSSLYSDTAWHATLSNLFQTWNTSQLLHKAMGGSRQPDRSQARFILIHTCIRGKSPFRILDAKLCGCLDFRCEKILVLTSSTRMRHIFWKN